MSRRRGQMHADEKRSLAGWNSNTWSLLRRATHIVEPFEAAYRKRQDQGMQGNIVRAQRPK